MSVELHFKIFNFRLDQCLIHLNSVYRDDTPLFGNLIAHDRQNNTNSPS